MVTFDQTFKNTGGAGPYLVDPDLLVEPGNRGEGNLFYNLILYLQE